MYFFDSLYPVFYNFSTHLRQLGDDLYDSTSDHQNPRGVSAGEEDPRRGERDGLLHCTVLYCTVLYCTVLYCTALYCTVLFCSVLYCTVLCDWDTATVTADQHLSVTPTDLNLLKFLPPTKTFSTHIDTTGYTLNNTNIARSPVPATLIQYVNYLREGFN